MNRAEQELRDQHLLLQQKDQMCEMIRGQVDMLAQELIQVQTDLISKEKHLQAKVQRLKEERASDAKEKRGLESRLKDQNGANQQRLDEI